jgi:hypothetical protein
MLLGTSGILCPLDIVHFLMPANCFASPSASQVKKTNTDTAYECNLPQSTANTPSISSFQASLPNPANMFKWKMDNAEEHSTEVEEAVEQSLRALTSSVANVSLDGNECTDMNFSDLDVSSRTSSSSGSDSSPIATPPHGEKSCIIMAAGPLTVVGDNIWGHP